jgi:hypothetical protein
MPSARRSNPGNQKQNLEIHSHERISADINLVAVEAGSGLPAKVSWPSQDGRSAISSMKALAGRQSCQLRHYRSVELLPVLHFAPDGESLHAHELVCFFRPAAEGGMARSQQTWFRARQREQVCSSFFLCFVVCVSGGRGQMKGSGLVGGCFKAGSTRSNRAQKSGALHFEGFQVSPHRKIIPAENCPDTQRRFAAA